MKRFTKLSLMTLGVGLAILTTYTIKRRFNDLTEDKILRKMENRYQGYPIKGTWIQRHGNHYTCEITVMANHHWQHHQFRCDPSGHLTLNA